MSGQRKRVTAEEFWAGMDELKEQIKETDRQLQENARQMKETEYWMREQKRETDRQIEKQKRVTDRRINYLDELFTGQWGKLMEALVEGDLIELLKERGIGVEGTHPRVKKTLNDGQDRYEFDIIATNGTEVVVVEVKTNLKVSEVKEFMNNLKLFKKIFPEYVDRTIYGAVAYLRCNSKADVYAEKQGLFVIRATGSSASITNKKTFKPKGFE